MVLCETDFMWVCLLQQTCYPQNKMFYLKLHDPKIYVKETRSDSFLGLMIQNCKEYDLHSLLHLFFSLFFFLSKGKILTKESSYWETSLAFFFFPNCHNLVIKQNNLSFLVVSFLQTPLHQLFCWDCMRVTPQPRHGMRELGQLTP